MTPTITTAEMREKLNDPTFDYVLACAEFCGQAHWNMKYTVVVETEEEYNKWVAEQKPIYDITANMAETKEETTTVSDTTKVVETQPAHPISELKK
jgi:cytochrome c oxidase subunit 2